ncbi:MAG: ABC transporter ATP-binding protein [Armatimonadota bacterium]|nr:ABC transporter ATP-binding protein [Armatimonadota bacterium]MDR5703151.1 ABC transporter ATP-binding protein [Armatimonadota bacterium]MDR7433979.1 ABC transporter ATP-binding protein [Armatimonadota bacterium]
MYAIETRNLTKRFGDLIAVHHLNLAVEEGTIFGLVGPDGAGKTTTIRLLATVLEPTEGMARICGRDVRTSPEEVKSLIGYMPQEFSIYADLTVAENLHFFGEIYHVPRRELIPRLDELLSMTRLAPFVHRLAMHLSGGMQKKLALACSLIHRPRVLLLDEPTTGVDPISRRELWRILYDLARSGVTILISTSYLDEAERCSAVGLLYRGHLIRSGSPAEVKGGLEGEVVEMIAEPRREARRLVEQRPEVHSVRQVGERLRLILPDARKAIPALSSWLRSQGIELIEVHPVEPSLEDLFASLIQSDSLRQQTGEAFFQG